MADKHLATYLNDHLAGSTSALELLEHLEAAHAGAEVGQLASDLLVDVATDRRELESLMEHLGIAVSQARKASAWLGEKLAALKLRIDDPSGGALHRFESLEVLSLGIEGKRGLWQALAAAAEDTPTLRIADYERLIQRAEEQRRRVEALRLEAARCALRPAG